MRRLDIFFSSQPAQHQFVRGLKDLRILGADSDQVGDVEEAPVIDPLASRPPEGELVSLLVQQIVQSIEAGGIAFDPVEAAQVGIQKFTDGGISLHHIPQVPL